MQKIQRYEGLEGLRALMALWVVIGHVGNFMGYYLGANAPGWVKLALLTNVPVNVFIALSGFVIFQMLHARTNLSYLSYIAGRARRIFPIYLVAVLIACTLISFRFDVHQMLPWSSQEEMLQLQDNYDLLKSNYLWHLIAHIFLLHGLIPESVLPNASQALLAPAWSLSLEWQFYLIAPVIYLIATKTINSFVFMLLIFTATTFLISKTGFSFTPAFFLMSWPYFALGWLSSLLIAHKSTSVDERSVASLLVCLGIVLFSICLFSSDLRSSLLSTGVWLLAFFASCGLWPKQKLLNVVNGILSMPFLTEIGKRSYSLYLLHVLIIDLVAYILIRGGVLSTNDPLSFLVLLACTIPLALLVSWISYSQIEFRFMRSSKVKS